MAATGPLLLRGLDLDVLAVYVSGQGPVNLATGGVVRGTIEEETTLTLEHVEKVLMAAGATMDNIVKCTVHLLDIDDFDCFNTAYRQFFDARGVTALPTRTTVQSGLFDNIEVEIDAVALVDE